MRTYHIDGSQPKAGQVFVFGSNLAGIHGAGAALAAYRNYGAKLGVAEGITGQSYAIPTVREKIAGPCSLEDIHAAVERFLAYTADHPEVEFFVTRVGCGLAGHHDGDIAPMFVNAPMNCSLPHTWHQFLRAAA